ncbi:hypothetical protein K437DRAFT_42178 [Tilletiaria anomala UBC 951]|uniref:Uncharacterized protein n=1 Tax=Tilletiaria anomala (strain ATCC 24038 / CBS 436.72 / UBC 951) TaxID=1037660 RepID=A0A066VAE5_TILAU|nr:uncharacterized protein K437DRAFT_42178 [Tilletiaria anomala UBC 951]KDN37258.1 hypothetical protein K437DRAFT_42178 [Tilletiaria anomala UBC 951]
MSLVPRKIANGWLSALQLTAKQVQAAFISGLGIIPCTIHSSLCGRGAFWSTSIHSDLSDGNESRAHFQGANMTLRRGMQHDAVGDQIEICPVARHDSHDLHCSQDHLR